MDTSHVVWILHDSKKEIVFIRASLLMGFMYHDKSFQQLLKEKPYIECCRMISRDLFKALKKQPSYIAIVADQHSEDGLGPLATEQCMDEILSQAHANPSLENIVQLAEGPLGMNMIGQTLTTLLQALVDKGFPEKKNKKNQNPKNDTTPAVAAATTHVS
jgi:hypothetical protein